VIYIAVGLEIQNIKLSFAGIRTNNFDFVVKVFLMLKPYII
jgi:hypothetical protein